MRTESEAGHAENGRTRRTDMLWQLAQSRTTRPIEWAGFLMLGQIMYANAPARSSTAIAAFGSFALVYYAAARYAARRVGR